MELILKDPNTNNVLGIMTDDNEQIGIGLPEAMLKYLLVIQVKDPDTVTPKTSTPPSGSGLNVKDYSV